MSPEHPTEPQLWLCREPCAYISAARAWTRGRGVPILGDQVGAGFGHEPTVAAVSEPLATPDREPASDGDPRRVIVTAAGGVVEAGARLLARASGRCLIVLEPGREGPSLDEVFARAPSLVSLTFAVPAWGDDGRPNPTRLFDLLRRAREHHTQLCDRPWGVITGADPLSFTRVIAKSIMGPEIAAAYAAAQSLVFTTGSASSNWISLPPFDPEAQNTDAPLLVVDDALVASKAALEVVARRWSLLFFKGHGRPYCACQGYLCGARSLVRSPTEPSERCVLGMDCASPRDGSYRPGFPAFPRVDPRRYDAPVVVMDCCGTGNLSSPVWGSGVPTVSFHALAGSASAVITGDQVTMVRSGSYLDVLWALHTSATLGEAVVRLNEVRPDANAKLPYFLLGDPELVAGATRWPGWVAEAARRDATRPDTLSFGLPASGATPFVRAVLSDAASTPSRDAAWTWTWTWFTSIEREAGVELGKPRAFRTSVGDELWLDLTRAKTDDHCIELRVEPRPSLTVDSSLYAAARSLEQRMRAWTPTVREWGAPLQKAGERVLRLGARLAELAGCAVVGEAADFEEALALTERGWVSAHAQLVSRAVEGLCAGGLWPFRLWAFSDFSGATDGRPCPYCGLQPTLLRAYRSAPVGTRQQWECNDCSLIQDRPPHTSFELEFNLPKRLRAGETAPVELRITNTSDSVIRGAAIAVVDGLGHGVTHEPSRAQGFELAAGAERHIALRFELPEPPSIAHTYWARALLLVDGVWQLSSRPLLVARGDP
ncbi:hypothetical protein [Enhygromyxa salina]|uniref:Uncharacterized protein n=1 Tax=Enhygromyxa salina TaxID=215803 RepID=A0A2S9Y5W2_9BACT|nr:hypothetical protein [Enhygromyxa salina]PRQ00493.1 hypothetical protein ENSA7_59870 [Enhygromyxa salina]